MKGSVAQERSVQYGDQTAIYQKRWKHIGKPKGLKLPRIEIQKQENQKQWEIKKLKFDHNGKMFEHKI